MSPCCFSCGYPIPAKLNPGNISCPADVSGIRASRTGSVSHAQQNSVIKLAPPKGKTEPSFLWTGDRWQSACRSTIVAQGVSPVGPDLGCVKAWVRYTVAPCNAHHLRFDTLACNAVGGRIISIGACWSSTTTQPHRCHGNKFGATRLPSISTPTPRFEPLTLAAASVVDALTTTRIASD